MKKILLTLFVFLAVNLSFAQQETIPEFDVPEAVRATFKSLYPNIKNYDVDWGKVGECYEAGFMNKEVETFAIIFPKGELKEIEVSILPMSLPKAAADYITSKLSPLPISEAWKTTDTKGVVTYGVNVEEIYYFFDAKGKMFKKEESE